MNISDIINDDEPKKESLHDKRWREMKKESSDRSFKMAREAAVASLPKKDNLHGDSKGKGLKFKPLVYYTAQDALQHCMKDFEDQASKNIDIIKATRETKGQKLTTKSDLKMVVGNFHEGKRMIKTGIFVPVYMYVFIREWCGSICIFEIAESDYGTGKMKRRGYTVEKVSVVYYQSNGVGMGVNGKRLLDGYLTGPWYVTGYLYDKETFLFIPDKRLLLILSTFLKRYVICFVVFISLIILFLSIT